MLKCTSDLFAHNYRPNTNTKKMYSVLIILAVIVAVLLTLIVLIQESKGGGLASSFSASNAIMGVRKTTDFIEKATWTLAGVLVVLSVVANLQKPAKAQQSEFMKGLNKTTELPAATQNAAGNQQAPAQNSQQAPAQK